MPGVFVVGLIAFLTVVDLFATQAILPTLTKAYGVTPAAMGLAVNASTLGMAISSLSVAFLSRRIPRQQGILWSLALLTLPTFCLAFAPDLIVFASLRVLQGIFMASAFVLTLAYLSENGTGTHTAEAFAAYITGNVASNLIGRLISAGLADHFGLVSNFIGFAILNLAGALLVYLTVKPMPRPSDSTMMSPWAALTLHWQNPPLRACFAIGFCILFAFIGTFTFVNFVLVRPPLSIDMMTLGFVYFVFLPSIFTTPLAGTFVARFGARTFIWSALLVAALGLPLLLTPSLGLVMVGLGLVGVGTFGAQAAVTGFNGRIAQGDKGSASGIYLACYFLGGLVGTALLGRIFDQFGWAACVAGVGLALMAAALLTLRLRAPAI